MSIADGRALVVSNLDDVTDVTFQNDRGWWNVTRAERDCRAGKHHQYLHDVEALYANNSNVEVERSKVDAYAANPAALAVPLILVVEEGKLWLIDGHHRLRAMHERGITDCVGYVIEEKRAAPYKVCFNGKRLPPWQDA